mgnify:CR=1 FL=1
MTDEDGVGARRGRQEGKNGKEEREREKGGEEGGRGGKNPRNVPREHFEIGWQWFKITPSKVPRRPLSNLLQPNPYAADSAKWNATLITSVQSHVSHSNAFSRRLSLNKKLTCFCRAVDQLLPTDLDKKDFTFTFHLLFRFLRSATIKFNYLSSHSLVLQNARRGRDISTGDSRFVVLTFHFVSFKFDLLCS